MTKVLEHNTTGNKIVVKDDYNADDFPGYTEKAPAAIVKSIAEIRAERDALLLASDGDWAKCTSMMWELGSYAEWKKSEHCKGWATYRKALRDIPQQDTFPETVNWPDKPE